jgi:hypothetical protein
VSVGLEVNNPAMRPAAPLSTPRQRVEAERGRRGLAAVVDGCALLLSNMSDDDPLDVDLVMVLGGEPAAVVLRDDVPEAQRYWLRVWAARGLLWAWDRHDPRGVEAVRRGLSDPAWRVREMCAKVVARHAVGDLWEAVAALRHDEIPRVRSAAHRALDSLTRHRA